MIMVLWQTKAEDGEEVSNLPKAFPSSAFSPVNMTKYFIHMRRDELYASIH